MKQNLFSTIKIWFLFAVIIFVCFWKTDALSQCNFNSSGPWYNVTSKLDNTPGCLRDAINSANLQNIGGRLNIGLDTVYLNSALPQITCNSLLVMGGFNTIVNAQFLAPYPIFNITGTNSCMANPPNNPTIINIAPSYFYVTNTNDTGAGSLRDAIIQSNLSSSYDRIYFNISGVSPHSIQPLTPLPQMNYSVIIDGSTQPPNGYFGNSPKIELDGSICGGTGLNFGYSYPHQASINIYGLFIHNFSTGVGCYNTANITMGAQYKGNVISGNTYGADLFLDSNITFQYNYVGTNPNGDSAFFNNWGARLVCSNPAGLNTITDNLISGNNKGMEASGSAAISVKRNLFGTDKTGTYAIPNNTYALLSVGPNAIIGGHNSNEGNLFSGNICSSAGGYFAVLHIGSYPQVIVGNKFGTDITGNDSIPNHNGSAILVLQSDGTIIGGSGANDRNIIATPPEYGGGGIFLMLSGNVRIENNYLGTNKYANKNFFSSGVGIGTNTLQDSIHILNNLIVGDSIGIAMSAYNGGNFLNEIKGNTIRNNSFTGIWNANEHSLFSNNSIYDNGFGIYSFWYANDSIKPPVIANITASNVSGTSRANAIIEIYYSQSQNNTAQGKTLIATVTADSLGNWNYNGAINMTLKVTATQTDNGNTSAFSGLISNVWPGDCNYDLTVDNIDFLYLNIAKGDIGSTRSGATLNWVAQPTSNWSNFFLNGANHKHADCDGNGIVDLNDTTAIIQNYSLTHPYKQAPQVYQAGLPDLKFVANVDTAFAGDSVTVAIYVDSVSAPVDSLLGIAYSVLFDAMLVDTNSISLSYDSSALGIVHTDMESISKNFFSNGKVDAAVCRTNHINMINFSGLLGTFKFKINQSLPLISQLTISPSSATGISQSGVLKSFNLIGDTLYIVDCNQPVQITVSDSILCFGDSLFCNAVSNYQSLYNWMVDSTLFSTDSSIVISGLNGGNHSIILNVSNAFCSNFYTENIFVDEPAKPNLIPSVYYVYSSINSNCQWYINGQLQLGANADSLLISNYGMYMVSVTDSFGCIAFSDSIYLIPVGISNYQTNNFLIYPNPASSELTIEFFNPNKSEINIQLLSLDGKEVFSERIIPSPRITIDSSKLSTGLYLIKIVQGNNIYFGKVSIVK